MKTLILCPSARMGLYVDRALSAKGINLQSATPVVDSIPLKTSENFSLVSPFIGSPAAAIAIESLKPDRLVFLGICGANLGAKLLDIFLPEKALPKDGTSKAYHAAQEIHHPSPALQKSFEQFLIKTFPEEKFLRGSITSCDRPGVSSEAIDMESGIVFHLAVELIAAYIVSDLSNGQAAFGSKALHKRLKLLAEASVGFLTAP